MINLLLGPPGGGKSYEATVYHVLVALNRGRKVVTNLPLVVDELELICPGSRELIELRFPERVDGQLVRPFGHISYYGDSWRHPEDGSGPLYVIDECHMCLPARGTPIEIEEWFAMHRHELADVLLITQSYGKINKSIRELVQVVYRCRKATALGSNGRYVRKVQDGLRGEIVNETIRTYESKYFKLYKSHTKSGAGQELAAADIKPIWSHWSFKGAVICMLAFLVLLYNMDNPFMPKLQSDESSPPAPLASSAPGARQQSGDSPSSPSIHPPAVSTAPPVRPASVPAAVPASAAPPPPEHPWSGYGMHVVAVVRGERNGQPTVMGLMRISQNGQAVSTVPFDDLIRAGYKLTVLSDCVVDLWFFGRSVGYAVCDAPRVGMNMPTPVAGTR